MKFTRPLFLVFAAAVGSTAVYAAETTQPVRAAQVKQATRQAPAVKTAVKSAVVETGYSDFDALNTVNDPLYRSGTKELLKQAVKEPAQAKPVLRDAPNSKPATLLNKPRLKKLPPADPVNIKNTL